MKIKEARTYGYNKTAGKKPKPLNDLNSLKGFFYYMIMILVVTVLLNGLVFPSACWSSQVKEVGYNEFLAMGRNNQITQVEKDDHKRPVHVYRERQQWKRAGLQDRTLG